MPSAPDRSCGARGNGHFPERRLVAAVAALLGVIISAGSAWAQGVPQGLLAPGNAAVTGYSGVTKPRQISPREDPRVQTFIDLDGASLRIVDLQSMGGSPRAQLVRAPKPYIFTAAQIGQVFGVALDNTTPPSIYVAATSAFGLPIASPGRDGRPRSEEHTSELQ